MAISSLTVSLSGNKFIYKIPIKAIIKIIIKIHFKGNLIASG